MSEAHPLFPQHEDEDEPRQVDFIQVTRFEATGLVWAQRVFAASEIQSLQDLFNFFGGGSYELIARAKTETGKCGLITDRARYPLDGPPRPLSGAPPPMAPIAGAPAPAAGADAGMIGLLLQFMMHQSAQSTQIMVAMLQASKSDSAAQLQAMAESSKAQVATMAQFFEAMGKNHSEQGDRPFEMFAKGIEFAKDIQPAAPAKEPSVIQEVLDGAGQAIAIATQLEDLRKNGQSPVPGQNGAPPRQIQEPPQHRTTEPPRAAE